MAWITTIQQTNCFGPIEYQTSLLFRSPLCLTHQTDFLLWLFLTTLSFSFFISLLILVSLYFSFPLPLSFSLLSFCSSLLYLSVLISIFFLLFISLLLTANSIEKRLYELNYTSKFEIPSEASDAVESIIKNNLMKNTTKLFK